MRQTDDKRSLSFVKLQRLALISKDMEVKLLQVLF